MKQSENWYQTLCCSHCKHFLCCSFLAFFSIMSSILKSLLLFSSSELSLSNLLFSFCASLKISVPRSGATILRHFLPPFSGQAVSVCGHNILDFQFCFIMFSLYGQHQLFCPLKVFLEKLTAVEMMKTMIIKIMQEVSMWRAEFIKLIITDYSKFALFSILTIFG